MKVDKCKIVLDASEPFLKEIADLSRETGFEYGFSIEDGHEPSVHSFYDEHCLMANPRLTSDKILCPTAINEMHPGWMTRCKPASSNPTPL